MIYRIAFASTDGVRVDSHFGAAERFYIAELDTEKEDCDITENVSARPACKGGEHEVSGFEAMLSQLGEVSAIVAQRIGPGAKKYIKEKGIAAYEIPLDIEQAVCLLMEEKQWEVDEWQYHTKS
ncbi:NifB/NifX family molybdenum-iron cluster-binding protein [Ruminococcus sp.]|uniref:NifB/NifX family molybdenum-iron cluster-binding protein n=1 Tax=Ruminococcus sp. TaxID=41978 RepID=UPI0025DD9028|nr:NifB/NifX family molybdenum-iron cluster-binding protein [Ruminococcus sp.]MBQ8965163.1 dinitrogenase iron-molybdenum cofactor biosynthesis protein [Ruminococcus sp.]